MGDNNNAEHIAKAGPHALAVTQLTYNGGIHNNGIHVTAAPTQCDAIQVAQANPTACVVFMNSAIINKLNNMLLAIIITNNMSL